MIIGAGFAGAGNAKVGLFTLLFGLFVVGLPAAIFLSKIIGLNAMWIGLSSSNVAGAALAFLLLWWGFPTRRESKKEVVKPTV
jgi:Na+-driven multidrug efflux pump